MFYSRFYYRFFIHVLFNPFQNTFYNVILFLMYQLFTYNQFSTNYVRYKNLFVRVEKYKEIWYVVSLQRSLKIQQIYFKICAKLKFPYPTSRKKQSPGTYTLPKKRQITIGTLHLDITQPSINYNCAPRPNEKRNRLPATRLPLSRFIITDDIFIMTRWCFHDIEWYIFYNCRL